MYYKHSIALFLVKNFFPLFLCFFFLFLLKLEASTYKAVTSGPNKRDKSFIELISLDRKHTNQIYNSKMKYFTLGLTSFAFASANRQAAQRQLDAIESAIRESDVNNLSDLTEAGWCPTLCSTMKYVENAGISQYAGVSASTARSTLNRACGASPCNNNQWGWSQLDRQLTAIGAEVDRVGLQTLISGGWCPALCSTLDSVLQNGVDEFAGVTSSEAKAALSDCSCDYQKSNGNKAAVKTQNYQLQRQLKKVEEVLSAEGQDLSTLADEGWCPALCGLMDFVETQGVVEFSGVSAAGARTALNRECGADCGTGDWGKNAINKQLGAIAVQLDTYGLDDLIDQGWCPALCETLDIVLFNGITDFDGVDSMTAKSALASCNCPYRKSDGKRSSTSELSLAASFADQAWNADYANQNSQAYKDLVGDLKKKIREQLDAGTGFAVDKDSIDITAVSQLTGDSTRKRRSTRGRRGLGVNYNTVALFDRSRTSPAQVLNQVSAATGVARSSIQQGRTTVGSSGSTGSAGSVGSGASSLTVSVSIAVAVLIAYV